MYGSVEGVKNYYPNVEKQRLGFDSPEALDEFITGLLEAGTVRIDAFLSQAPLDEDDPVLPGVVEVLERRVAGVFPLVSQMNASPVMKYDDFSIQVVNTSGLWNGLEEELLPFDTGEGSQSPIQMFHTGGRG